MRLPSGEIELTTATALERAFQCGLVDARTPLRAVGSHVWTQLGEAAELDTTATGSSFAPVAIDDPAPDLNDGARWHVRKHVDAGAFRPRMGGKLAAMLAMAAVVCTIGLASTLSGVAPGSFAAATSLVTMPASPVASAFPVHTLPEVERHSPRDLERLTKEQVKRLHDLDFARRWRGDDLPRNWRQTLHKPLMPSARPAGASDPFANTGSPFDPLNGSF